MDPLTILLVTALVVIILWRRNTNLPPGPWNLPVVGYLPWLDPKAPHLSLTHLARKYGPVYGLYMGSIYTVVLSDAKLVKKVFNKDAAAGRAPLYLTHGIMKGYGLICAEGELWKDQRKFVHNTLRTLGGAKVSQNRNNLQELIMEDVTELVEFIKSKGDKFTMDLLEPLRHSLGSAINKIVFGKSWLRDDPTWKWLLDLQEEGTKLIGVAGPLNFLSFLRFLPKFRQTMDFLLEGKQKTHVLYQEIIHSEETAGASCVSDVCTNFIQAFLSERAKRKGTLSFDQFYNDQQFNHLLADVFGASLDTTLATLRWYILFLAANQDIQLKLRSSLEESVGKKLVTMNDFGRVPYMEATIAEVQRIRSVVPVGIPHGSLDALEIENFSVPKGTMIVPLQWAIHMDPKVWDEPERFRPNRFLDEEGKFYKPEAFIPFQSGKRMCVGDELARMFLFLYGASLVQNFHIDCGNLDEIDLNGDCGITLTPKLHELTFTKI